MLGNADVITRSICPLDSLTQCVGLFERGLQFDLRHQFHDLLSLAFLVGLDMLANYLLDKAGDVFKSGFFSELFPLITFLLLTCAPFAQVSAAAVACAKDSRAQSDVIKIGFV